MNPLRLVRETDWIKEWETPWGRVIDSKLRWLGQATEPTGAAFVAAWEAADEAGRADLEAAFVFFPHELAGDVAAILAHVAAADTERAERMRAGHFSADSELSPAQQQFIDALNAHVTRTNATMEPVGENQWFAAFRNEAGFHIETKIAGPWEMPTEAEWRVLLEEAKPLAYRRVIEMLMRSPELLMPAEGEAMFPGLG